jgi:hypothetical protein
MPTNAFGKFINEEALRPGDLVIWTCPSEMRGQIGIVKRSFAELATVSFPEGEWNFKETSLRKLAEGDSMQYIGKNADIPRGDFGLLVLSKPTGIISVQYKMTTEPKVNTVVKYVGDFEGVPKDEFGMVRTVSYYKKKEGDEEVIVITTAVQYQTRLWDNLPLEDLRLEFDIPYVALKYIDVKTALTATNREFGARQSLKA